MKLNEVLNNLDFTLIKGTLDVTVDKLSINSNDIEENTMFFCLKGLKFDSHDIIDEIAKLQVSTIAIDRELENYPDNVTIIKVSDMRKFISMCSRNFYKIDQFDLNYYGVTGTNGKTSIVHFLKSVLTHFNEKTASIGTLGFLVDDYSINLPVKTVTTPDSIELNYLINEMAKQDVKNICMEVTSHGLLYDKCYGYRFKSSIFTNLTPDHIETHKTLENYAACKKKLFKMSEIGIFNLDDEYAKEFIDESTCKIVTYAIDTDADFRAFDIQYSINSVTYKIKNNENIYDVYIPIPGKFTVYNSLSVIAMLATEGYNINELIKAFKTVTGVPGRVQNIENDRGISILIDYAHTADALENVINSVINSTNGNIITVFGCGGGKDTTKRVDMGRISGKLSNYTVVTMDNPRFDDPNEIISHIESGLKEVTNNYISILDREEAIKYAIEYAKEGDTIIIAGKGHENYQDIQGIKYPSNDSEIVKNILKSNK